MSSFIQNLRFSDRATSGVSADTGLPPYDNDTFVETFTETKMCAIGKDGIRINYDLDTIAPKYFEMTKDGVVFAETGQPTYTTGLGRLCAVQQAFQAVELPPNATTLKINDTILVDAGIANQTTTINDGNITITGSGLSANPVLTLNQGGSGSGILYEEFYNQRTAQTGEFNRMSFYGKSSTGVKTEYARIHQNAPVITSGSVRGKLDFGVQQGSGIVDYLILNGQVGSVGLGATLDCNSNNIQECNSITTPNSNQYSKEQVVYLTTNITAPTGGLDTNLRYTAVNLGKSPEWLQASSITTNGFISGVENITASYDNWDGKFWVGTDVGNIYYSSDGGANWTLQSSYGGRIRVFCPYNGASVMAVGGDFSSVSYNYLVGIYNSTFSYNSFDITGGNLGMNASVYTIYDNGANSCLYIGGAFTDYYGILSNLYPKWITLDYNTATFYSFSAVSGDGFFGGDVLSITKDTANSNFIIVGGSFTTGTANASGFTIPYLFTYSTSNGYDLTSYFGIPSALNAPVSVVIPYSGGIMSIGGAFTNPLISPTWTDNYGMNINWNGSSWDESNYPFFSPSQPITSIIHFPNLGVFYTIVGSSTLYANSTQYATIPIGSSWDCVAYNGSTTLFATNAQTSAGFLFYQYDQSVGVNISSGVWTFNSISGSGFTNCYLTYTNSSVEMLWNSSLNKWFVISQEGCAFS